MVPQKGLVVNKKSGGFCGSSLKPVLYKNCGGIGLSYSLGRRQDTPARSTFRV